MGRAPCCDKANVKKGPWSPEEDSKLKEYIEKFGTGGNWIALPQKAGKIITSTSKINGFDFMGACFSYMSGCFLMNRSEKMWKELQIEMAKLSETQH